MVVRAVTLIDATIAIVHPHVVGIHLRVVAMDRGVAMDWMVAMDCVLAMIARLRVDILPIAHLRVAAMDRAVATDALVVIARSREDVIRSEVKIDTMVGIARRQEAGIVRGTRIDLANTSHIGEMTISRNESRIRFQDLLDTPMGIRSSLPGTEDR